MENLKIRKISSSGQKEVENMKIGKFSQKWGSYVKLILVALDNMQKYNCILSNVVIVWKNLRKTPKDYGSCKKFLNKWYEKTLTPAHFLAYLLNSTSGMLCLTVNGKDQASNFVKAWLKF